MTERWYWIETWGCQMNEHDSEKMAGVLEGLGYRPADRAEQADVVLLNTCAIREKAEEKIYQYLYRLRPAKERRPEMIVGVCGCVGQMAAEGILERVPFVDLVIGPRAAARLPEHLSRLKQGRGVVDTTLYQDDLFAGGRTARREPGRHKAYVTIMEGCNKACAYCIVPTTRGREVSRPLDDVLGEVMRLADEGFREVEFLGQNVNGWRDRATGAGLGDLLRAAGRMPGVRRLRFTTSHPIHLGPDIIRAMAEVPEVCDHLHLPVQSGSSRVLRAMKRGYDRKRYLRKVDELRAAVPTLALSTDIIVGYPGETEEDFEETLSLVREVGFDQMFSFVYSPRPGTAAALLPDRGTTPERKAERLTELQALQRSIQLRRHAALVGSTLRVVVEAPSRRDPGEWAGRSTSNRIVNVRAPGVGIGDELDVQVVAAGPNSLKGQPVTRPAAGVDPASAATGPR
jgi:tRNA-2-methylthio-N6-dimethylallyladenosine synthase